MHNQNPIVQRCISISDENLKKLRKARYKLNTEPVEFKITMKIIKRNMQLLEVTSEKLRKI